MGKYIEYMYNSMFKYMLIEEVSRLFPGANPESPHLHDRYICFATLPSGSRWNKPTLFKALIVSDAYNVNGKMYVTKFCCREHRATTLIIINI